MNGKIKIILIALGFLMLAAIFHFSSPNIPDWDAMYYMRQSWLYRTQGLFNSDFPWMQDSIVKDLSSSVWYGFGILLIPFTYFPDLVFGIKFAGVLFTAGTLFGYWWVLKRQKIKMALLWPLVFFFSAPNVLFRFLMTRTQLVSLGLSVLLISFLINGGWLGIFLTTFGIVWIHFNLFWLPILLWMIFAFLQFIFVKQIDWQKCWALFAGVLLGWVLRPNPIGALKLVYIQVIKHTLNKQEGLPLLFGQEHYPLPWVTLFRNFWAFLVLWIGAAVVLWIFYLKQKYQKKDRAMSLADNEKIFLWMNLILSILFFGLTMVVARRAYDFWVAYGVLFLAGTLTFVLGKQFFKNIMEAVQIGIVLIFIFMFFYSTYINNISMKTAAYPPNSFKEIGAWLNANSQSNDVVFNLRWSDFSPLFFWDQKNYYVGGLDPIFQYEYDPSLYWKFHYLSANLLTDKTCGAIECTNNNAEDTHTVLVRDFHAKYITFIKNQYPKMLQYLESDSRYEKKVETGREILFEVR